MNNSSDRPPVRPPARNIRKKLGRPSAGLKRGESRDRVRDYPTLTLRVPPETRSLLAALCYALDRPLWRVIRHVSEHYASQLRISQPSRYQELVVEYKKLQGADLKFDAIDLRTW
jgi:hypothetical protein